MRTVGGFSFVQVGCIFLTIIAGIENTERVASDFSNGFESTVRIRRGKCYARLGFFLTMSSKRYMSVDS